MPSGKKHGDQFTLCMHRDKVALLWNKDDFFETEAARRNATLSFVRAHGLLPEQTSTLYLLDSATAQFTATLKRFQSDKRGVLVLHSDNTHAIRLAKSLGFPILPPRLARRDHLALVYDLISIGFAVVRVESTIQGRIDALLGEADIEKYRGAYQVFRPTKPAKRVLRIAAFAKHRLEAASVDEIVQAVCDRLRMAAMGEERSAVLHSFPPPNRFAVLRACDGTGDYFSCDNNPTCDNEDGLCEHKGELVEFADQHNWKRFWIQKSEREAVWRKLLLRMQASLGYANPKKRLLVMTFNIGFAHLFANWVCSLQRNKVNMAHIKAHLLIIATDELAIQYVTGLGFFAPTLDEVQALKQWTNFDELQAKPSNAFGSSIHKKINLLLKFSLPLDLLNLGYSVMIQDVDLIWTRNAFALVHDKYCREDDSKCDAIFIHEKRGFVDWRQAGEIAWIRKNNSLARDKFPEANTGMFLLKPTRAMIDFLEVLLEANRLQQWYARDQIVWNTLLYHVLAPAVRIRLLPHEIFVPGQYIRPTYVAQGHPIPTLERGLVAIHASDTSSFRSKYHRFVDIGHWYFDAKCGAAHARCAAMEKCISPFNESLAFCRSTDEKCLKAQGQVVAQS